mgnify:FL=1
MVISTSEKFRRRYRAFITNLRIFHFEKYISNYGAEFIAKINPSIVPTTHDKKIKANISANVLYW